MIPEIGEALRARVTAGEIERIGVRWFSPLVSLGSGARVGLAARDGDDAIPAWAIVEGEELVEFSPERVVRFAEVIESDRATFDEQLEAAAGALGYPAEAVLFSFPAIALVRAMLEKDRAHFSRLALLWLLPTELRLLRSDIARLVDNELLPRQLRDLAERLVVPE